MTDSGEVHRDVLWDWWGWASSRLFGHSRAAPVMLGGVSCRSAVPLSMSSGVGETVAGV